MVNDANASGDLRLSRIGLGLAALGRPGYINLRHGDDLMHQYDPDSMRSHSWKVLDAAWDHGIRYFDTARGYGRAEEFLSGWLIDRKIAPADVVVGSKWGYTYTAGWSVDAPIHEVKDHSLPTLERQYAESTTLLKPWLKLYQIHSATESSGVLDRSDVLDYLASVRAERKIAIGVTLSGVDAAHTLERVMTIHRDGRRLFGTVQATWNLLEPSLGSLLHAAHEAGVTVIVKEALANGRLTARNDGAEVSRIKALGERLGYTIDQLALAAVLDQPWADCVLSGAATAEQLSSNVGALSVSLDDDARTTLRSLAEPSETYWNTRARLRWN